jgi:two-component system nitrate/nitrite response regulator NarL
MLCDDHALFTEALTTVLTTRGFDVVHSGADPGAALDLAESGAGMGEPPDLCLFDQHMLGMSGVDAARRIRGAGSGTKVMLVSDALDHDAWAAYDDHTISGLVDKRCSFDALERVMWRVLAGEHVAEGCSRPAVLRPLVDPLSLREYEVLCLIVDGASTERMTMSLGVSSNTVRSHVASVLRKLGVHGRAKAARRAVELGIVSLPRARAV